MPTEKLPLPSQEQLLSMLRYEPDSGKLFWLPRTIGQFKNGHGRSAEWRCNLWNSRFSGKEAFAIVTPMGYRAGTINRVKFKAHRIIFKMVYGVEPIDIDHIDGDTSNNKLENLRNVPHADNTRNARKRKDNSSGVCGVGWHSQKQKFVAYIGINGGTKSLGYFDDFDAAVTRRKQAEKEHEFHRNHGRG